MSKKQRKPKRGRPPVAEPLRKRNFRCTDAEWELIEAASREGNRSQFIRERVVAAARRVIGR